MVRLQSFGYAVWKSAHTDVSIAYACPSTSAFWCAGKTLQGIALLWTLLKSGHDLLGGAPIAKRVIIVCPTSLVGNWESECQKWLKVPA